MGKLKRQVEKANRTLSSQASTNLDFESFEGGNNNNNNFLETLTRATFEGIKMDVFQTMRKLVEQVLKDANVKETSMMHDNLGSVHCAY